ncbi:putative sulfate exporter family transporter [Pirellulales bacterium]|nr:putative sulfate exporter family transporter [Pirellulales bacterium]
MSRNQGEAIEALPSDKGRISEDWLANWIGGALLVASLAAVLAALPADASPILNPIEPLFAKPAVWTSNPLSAWQPSESTNLWPAALGVFVLSACAFGIGVRLRGESATKFFCGFLAVFFLALVALTVAAQTTIKAYNLEYALWALAIGMLISNTIGAPEWIKPAVLTEFYIKTGLVLYGAKVLFGTLLTLGPPGLCVAWIVTPIVLITTYWFGQRVLKIPSRELNMVISADMSVCGVSAAIATAAACRAKKEELTLAIGISLSFTVVMMVLLPAIVRATGMNEVVGGAWIGGTIDSTGAVGAAGEMISEAAGNAAITIKLIQNLLIGVLAFGVALYWVRVVERDSEGPRPDAWEIWRRFPKFVLGFLVASLVFSTVHAMLPRGPEIVTAALKDGTEPLRSWFFTLAFVSIGLESNFRELGQHLRGGKPLLLYASGQALNLLLTLLMAWLMFTKVFPEAAHGVQ